MISLIVCTKNRTQPLRELFFSLLAQQNASFEVILIDQNETSIVESIVSEFPGLDITHKKTSTGLSLGRNIGLGIAKGCIIAFPDDDCLFDDPFLLEKVEQEMKQNTKVAGITIRSLGSVTKEPLMRFPINRKILSKHEIWHSTSSITFFLRKDKIEGILFNEELGLGSSGPFQSGEETDFLLKLLAKNEQLEFNPNMHISHPSFIVQYDESAFNRAYIYGLGQGRVLRNNDTDLITLISLIGRPIVGLCLCLATLQKKKATYYLWSAKGRIQGYLCKRA